MSDQAPAPNEHVRAYRLDCVSCGARYLTGSDGVAVDRLRRVWQAAHCQPQVWALIERSGRCRTDWQRVS